MLIITDDLLGTRPVVQELGRRGKSASCFSLGLLARGSLSAGVWDEAAVFYAAGHRHEVKRDSRVWRWKDAALSALVGLDDNEVVNAMKIDQYRALLRSIWEFPAHWMNSRGAESRLDQNKTHGSDVARHHGLVSPPTLITDSPEAISDFLEQNESQFFAVKAPAMWAARLPGGGAVATYTSRLGRSHVEAIASKVRFGPILIQPYVSKHHELRVTVVGKHVFACRIDSQTVYGAEIDWRMRPNDPVPYTAVQLQPSLHSSILAFMQACALTYGTLDFIVTPEGETIFLEINPAGQYLWIEERTGLQITSAIADWLEGND